MLSLSWPGSFCRQADRCFPQWFSSWDGYCSINIATLLESMGTGQPMMTKTWTASTALTKNIPNAPTLDAATTTTLLPLSTNPPLQISRKIWIGTGLSLARVTKESSVRMSGTSMECAISSALWRISKIGTLKNRFSDTISSLLLRRPKCTRR